jgi:hypothetical protein
LTVSLSHLNIGNWTDDQSQEMLPVMTTHTTDRILHALFCLSRDTHPIDASRLGRVTGNSATQAARALVLMEQYGWVDATRARLTFRGLARAVQLDASTGGQGGARCLDARLERMNYAQDRCAAHAAAITPLTSSRPRHGNRGNRGMRGKLETRAEATSPPLAAADEHAPNA